MSKIETVRAAMMQAMKEKDKPRKDALSSLLAALKAKAIDKRADLTEEEENAVVRREIKQLKETMESAPEGRSDIREECQTRIAVYEEFVPRQMDEEEVAAIIDTVLQELGLDSPTAKDKGLIMKNLMPRVKGKADGGMVNRLVAARLS